MDVRANERQALWSTLRQCCVVVLAAIALNWWITTATAMFSKHFAFERQSLWDRVTYAEALTRGGFAMWMLPLFFTLIWLARVSIATGTDGNRLLRIVSVVVAVQMAAETALGLLACVAVFRNSSYSVPTFGLSTNRALEILSVILWSVPGAALGLVALATIRTLRIASDSSDGEPSDENESELDELPVADLT